MFHLETFSLGYYFVTRNINLSLFTNGNQTKKNLSAK